jgi:hypothetical protein
MALFVQKNSVMLGTYQDNILATEYFKVFEQKMDLVWLE